MQRHGLQLLHATAPRTTSSAVTATISVASPISSVRTSQQQQQHQQQRADQLLFVLNVDIGHVALSWLWQSAVLRVCADGGANRLYNSFNGHPGKREQFVPEIIHGDLDSLHPAVSSFYQKLGTNISKNPEQDNNDLDKCFELIHAQNKAAAAAAITESSRSADASSDDPNSCKRKQSVLILGAFGGRIDQQMANINAAARWREHFEVVLLSDASLGMVLGAGEHEVHLDKSVETEVCGIFPLGDAVAHVTTTGLRWELDEMELSMCGRVSSSNEVLGESVRIVTDAPVLWTTVLEWPEEEEKGGDERGNVM